MRSLLIMALAVALLCWTAMPAAADDHDADAMDPATRAKVEEALSSDHRSDADKARDVYRKPLETLSFCGLEHTMAVAEIWPGGGWYQKIIAPVLRDQGTYYAAGWDPDSDSEWIQNAIKRTNERLASRPDIYDGVQSTVFAGDKTHLMAPDGSLDMILTFRNLHNWMSFGFAGEAMATFAKKLKPGGVLCIVDHRWPDDQPQDLLAKNGYVSERYTITLAKAAGLMPTGRSDLLANPQDTKDYEAGVWTLPPTLRLAEKERDVYTAIGESDRYLLKFEKPEK